MLLADHIKKKDMTFIYRVKNIKKAVDYLSSRGWKKQKGLEIPKGPCCTFRDPANNNIAIYEKDRPHVMEGFNGRIDHG